MAKLVVRKLGSEFAQLELIHGQEYVIGRSPECALKLEDTKGISRQHLRLFFADGVWVVELLSRYGTLIFEGENAEAIELADKVSFSVPPYEFLFIDIQEREEQQASFASEAPVLEEKSLVAQQPTELTPMNSQFSQTPMALSQLGESTSAGMTHLVPYLKITYPDHGKDEVVKLEGNLWVAGRDPSCEIPIEDHHVSRRHFELTQTNEGFYITDLGSANGTQVNGQKIPANEPRMLQSGDRVSIMDVSIDFEVRDTLFEKRLQQASMNLPALSSAPGGGMMPYPGMYPGMMMPYDPAGPGAIKVEPEGKKKFSLHDLKDPAYLKKNKARIAIIALIPVILFGLLSEEPKKVEKKDSASSSITFENLTPEQKTAIKDSFQLATNLYVKGKYELCQAELKKLHEMIPQYENSKELQTFCEQGSILVQKQKDQIRLQQEKERMEQQIRMVTEDCKRKINDSITLAEIEKCLGPAIERDPEHFLIIEVIQEVESIEMQRKEREQALEAQRARVQAGKNHFNRAKRLYKQGRLAAALREYRSFLNRNYPTLTNEESVARREIASVKQELDAKVDSLIKNCKTLRSEGKYKEAYLSCAKAKEEDPNNSKAAEEMKSAEIELNRTMKSLYEDSVIEESLGNIDAAKQKWKKILDEDLKNGEYFGKAKRKLQKYGAGI